jgi:steroid delta-isomerase-like uncharacterized protein
MNLDYAKRWADALSTDTDALADLYAADGEFCAERHMMDDHMQDTISDRTTLLERLGGLANGDPDNGVGIHTFTATEYIGDERYGLIHWDYTCEHATNYRGLPADGKRLQTKGSTFLQFNADGKIVLESTCFNDNPIFQELGIPVATPHYWDADFDPAALAAG